MKVELSPIVFETDLTEEEREIIAQGMEG